MTRRQARPKFCEPYSLRDPGPQLRASHERMLASPFAKRAPAWRLWSTCISLTAGYSKGSDQVYLTTLARLAGIDRADCGKWLRAFDELAIFSWQGGGRGKGFGLLSLPAVGVPSNPITTPPVGVPDNPITTPPVGVPEHPATKGQGQPVGLSQTPDPGAGEQQCLEDGCSSTAIKKGWCRRHWPFTTLDWKEA